jgi:murein DD-endopeptidase MepM/ murein hydrolase activator NlpD
MASIYQACKMAKGIFDARQIKNGQPFSIVRDPKRRLEVKFFIFENTPENFIVFKFGKSPDVLIGQKNLRKKTRKISGTVRSTLWGAMKEQGARTDLILKFEEVLSLKIDLNKLKPEDSFDVVFEEYGDGVRIVKTGAILSARLISCGKQFTAYQYSHHGITGYYDKDGNNFHRAFLKSPLRYKKVTSKFSLKRRHPITQEIRKHPAIDYGAPAGTPVMNVGDGIIKDVGYSSTAGNYIKIKHAPLFTSQYLHLNSIAGGLKTGLKVRKGDVIGRVGSTGTVTGPHLDFRFSKNGQLVDYSNIDLPSGQPVDEACKNDFKMAVKSMNTKLVKYESKDFGAL